MEQGGTGTGESGAAMNDLTRSPIVGPHLAAVHMASELMSCVIRVRVSSAAIVSVLATGGGVMVVTDRLRGRTRTR